MKQLIALIIFLKVITKQNKEKKKWPQQIL